MAKFAGQIIGLIFLIALSVYLLLGFFGVWFFLPKTYVKNLSSGVENRRRPPKQLVCLGDSTLYGMFLINWYRHAIPHRLQKKLGSAWQVVNLAQNKACCQSSAKLPFTSYRKFQLSFLTRPDVLFIMFGTNDSKAENWLDTDHFTTVYRQFLKQYSDRFPDAEIILGVPPAAFVCKGKAEGMITAYGVDLTNLSRIQDAVRALGRQMDLLVLDVGQLTAGHPEWFCFDGVHLNRKGTEVVSLAIEQCMQGQAILSSDIDRRNV